MKWDYLHSPTLDSHDQHNTLQCYTILQIQPHTGNILQDNIIEINHAIYSSKSTRVPIIKIFFIKIAN